MSTPRLQSLRWQQSGPYPYNKLSFRSSPPLGNHLSLYYDKEQDIICKDHTDNWTNLNHELRIFQRIGSSSMNGFVYQTMISTLDGDRSMVALKLIPLTFDFPLEKAIHEITTARRLSVDHSFQSIVPHVFGYGVIELNDTPSTEDFFDTMRLYTFYEYAKQQNISKRTMIAIKKMTTLDSQPMMNAEEIATLKQQWMATQGLPKCAFLVSELADGDFGQLLSKSIPYSTWQTIFIQLLKMIRIFFTTFIHGDFHVGNILYSYDHPTKSYHLMIHDFDTSEWLSELSITQQKEKIQNDLSSFLDKSLRVIDNESHPLFRYYTSVIKEWKNTDWSVVIDPSQIVDVFESIMTHHFDKLTDKKEVTENIDIQVPIGNVQSSTTLKEQLKQQLQR